MNEAKDKREPKSDREIEQWLSAAPPAWRDNFLFLRANNIPVKDSLLVAWMALDRSSRKKAGLETREHLADFLGVSRPVTYQWEERHVWEEKDLRYWADVLRIRHMAERLGDVDENLYRRAKNADTTANMIALYYKRAGLQLDERTLHVMGEGDQPIQFEDMKDELERRLAKVAAGGGAAEISGQPDAA